MTDEQRKAAQEALARRKAAKDAYDKERERIEPLRLAWVKADHEIRKMFKAMNVTKADSVFHD